MVRQARKVVGTPHIRRVVSCCFPSRLLEYHGDYSRMVMAERKDDG